MRNVTRHLEQKKRNCEIYVHDCRARAGPARQTCMAVVVRQPLPLVSLRESNESIICVVVNKRWILESKLPVLHFLVAVKHQ